MELCRCSYLILGILRAADATDRIHGLTVNEIHGFERLSKPNTIYKKIRELESSGLISEGVRAGRSKTYFMTSEGSGLLPDKYRKENIENE
jgi:DNA-binding PadR family transcriptional regulator